MKARLLLATTITALALLPSAGAEDTPTTVPPMVSHSDPFPASASSTTTTVERLPVTS